MSRPKLEVADIFRRHGAAWRFFQVPEFANRGRQLLARWQNIYARDNNPPCGCEPPARPRDDFLQAVFLSQTPAPKPRSRRDVAEHFEKRHADVLRNIDELLHSSDVRDGWQTRAEPEKEPEKDKDAAILDCALGNRPSTGTNGGAVGGRLFQQRGRHSLVPAAERRKQKENPGTCQAAPRLSRVTRR
jgi:hypothetical protein